MALAWFTVRTVGTLLGPFAIVTAFMAYAPSALDHLALVLGLSIGFGLVCGYPRKLGAKAVALRVLYILVMVEALLFWTLIAAAWFPGAMRYLKPGL